MKLTDYILVPKGVTDAADKGLQLRREYRRGGTSVGMNTARQLTTRYEIPLKKVLHIAKYFPRHAGDNLDQKNPPSNGYIAWLLWGGDPGRRWATRWRDKWERERGRG